MTAAININSLCEHITDERLNELLPDVPDSVRIDFYGHVRVKQTSYGMWSVCVELDINGTKRGLSFRTNNEDMKLVLEGADYRDFGMTYADAVDSALVMAIDHNQTELADYISEAAE